MTNIPLFVRACHPEPTAAVTALAAALAASVDANPVAVGAAFLSGQLSVGWSNDWVDAQRDRITRRSDKPTMRGLPPLALRNAALTAAGLCVPLSFTMGLRAGILHLLAVASAWAYNLRLKATVLSFLPYAFSFGMVPSIVTLAAPLHEPAPWWATVAGALLGLGAHGANVLPDMAEDVAVGVVGLPHRLGRRVTTVASGALLVAATAVLAFGPGSTGLGLAVAGLSVLVFVVGLVAGGRAPFLSVIVVAVLDVVLLLLRGGSLTAGG